MKKLIIAAGLLLILLADLPLRAQVIGMRVPDSTVTSGDLIDVPVYADNTLTGNNVLSYALQLSFNQSYLQVQSVITAGTLSAPFGSPAVNTAIPGLVTIAAAGVAPLTGSGKFIYIRFKALQPGGIVVNFTGIQYNYFNEGSPSMTYDPGVISVSPAPSVAISPNSGNITKGETLQFSVSGGTAPYQWFVTNPSVASVSALGLLTGTQQGFTNVVVVDNGGLRDTTNTPIEIRAMRLSIPNNLSQWQGSDINIPVNTTDLTGLNILAGNFSIAFNQNLITPTGIIQAGSLLASYPAPVYNTSVPGIFSVDFAGTIPLTGSGTLLYITFHVSALNAGGTPLNFTGGLFNEILPPNFTNGYFTTINLPVLSISPGTGSLVAGQTMQFTLNGGGTPPIAWSTSNPLVATISQSGLMTTFRGGNVTVTATDFHGASASSANWVVYDTQVIMPDTATCPASGEFYYPIVIRSLPPGETVNSVQGTLTYNATYLAFQNLETTGTLTQGWTFVNNAMTGQVILAGSGTSSFNTAGIIVKARFTLLPAFTVGSNASVHLPVFSLNEGVPNPLIDTYGYLAGVNPYTVGISVSASNNPVYTGSSVTFTATPANGGPGPLYQWKVNGSDVPGATNPAYAYVPVNNDAVSCVLTSNASCITGNPATSNTVIMSVVAVPSNITVTGNIPGGQIKCYSATNTITVAGGITTFTVQSGSSVTMIAGLSVDFLPGTRVFPGGYLHAYIMPGGPYCVGPPSAPIAFIPADPVSDSPRSFFRIYPNPTGGDFEFELLEKTGNEQVNVEIFGIQGRKIVSAALNNVMHQAFTLSALPAGIYFIRVTAGNRVETRKIIRQ